MGWFSSKYVGGARKARELGRQVRELRAKADSLARPGLARSGWEFPGEATSYGLAQVRVMLSQLARHAASPLHMLLREEEAKQQRLDAEQRLAALEALRAVRLRVEPFAAGRPAAQLALGRLLRRAHDLIERPTFGQTQQADLTNLLQTAEAWLSDSTRDAKYREALVERRRSDEIPNLGLDPARKAVPAVVHDQLVELLGQCPTAEVIADQQATPPAKLQGCDQTLAKLALLWRERATDWAAQLATMCGKGQPIEALFSLVDDETWKRLAAATDGELRLERHPPLPERLETYQLVEVRLRSSIPHLSEARIFRHPLRVGWRITPPGGHLRSMETNGLTLVQYFPLPGTVAIEASLRWQGREIPLGTEPLRFTVDPNPEYGRLRVLRSELTEWAAIAIAAGFAVATAMSTLYDPTFGSFGQYLALFLWAAGAGTGGNIFKELGATATPGGRSDATLPAAAPGGTAAAGR